MRDPCFPLLVAFVVILTSAIGVLGPSDFAGLINKWQNLIAAVIAVASAAVAYYGLNRQLLQNEKQEHHRRERKCAATRSMLPLAMSRIVDYAERSARDLDSLSSLCQGNVLPKLSDIGRLPLALPEEILKVFTDFIESADQDTVLLEDMVSLMQIHNSRVHDLTRRNLVSGSIVMKANIESSILDAALIYAHAMPFFEYSRRHKPYIPKNISWSHVRQALCVIFISSNVPQGVLEYVDQAESRGSSDPFAYLFSREAPN